MKDFNGYIYKMKQALEEKLFFLDVIDIQEYDLIVDFGCADGTLLNHIKLNIKDSKMRFIGFDVSEKMVRYARENSDPEIDFTTSFQKVIRAFQNSKKSLIVFSSVWHEIDKTFYNSILNFASSANTVVIRDMFFDEGDLISPSVSPEVFVNLKNFASKKMLVEHEEIYGKIDTNFKSFYMFLLKYTYIDNWESEKLEDYFSTPWRKIQDFFLGGDYKTFFDYKYVLPFKKEQVKKDFDYDMNDFTHRKIIFIKHKN